MSGHNFENLKAHILARSRASNFEDARREWELESVEITDDFDSCPCGQDIKEHCYIRNRYTNKCTYVGNVCVNRFMQIKTDTLFDGLKRIAKDLSANANLDVIEYAWKSCLIHDRREYDFLVSTMRKRKLSAKQISWKKKVNRRILLGIVVRKRSKN